MRARCCVRGRGRARQAAARFRLFTSGRDTHAWLLWAELGPSKMNSSTTPKLHVTRTCGTVLRGKREPEKPFYSSFSPRLQSSRACRAPFRAAPRAAEAQQARPGAARLPRAVPPQSAITTARSRIGASLASCFACACAPYAAGSARKAHELVVLAPGELAQRRPCARAADPRAGGA